MLKGSQLRGGAPPGEQGTVLTLRFATTYVISRPAICRRFGPSAFVHTYAAVWA